MKIELPYPPSLNRYYRTWKGRMLISEPGRDYRKAVQGTCLVRPDRRTLTGRLKMWIDLYVPDRRARDLDNCLKAIQDSLQHAGVYESDSQIDDLRIMRCGMEAGGTVIVDIEEIKANG